MVVLYGATRYTAVSGIRKHNAKESSCILPVPNEKDFKHFEKVSLFGLKLLKNDEYVARSKIKDSVFNIITSVEWIFNVEDDNSLFDEQSFENARKIAKQYLKLKGDMPNIHVKWKGLKTDEEISLFAFGGLGCMYIKVINQKLSHLQTTAYNDSTAGTAPANLIPSNAMYKSDFTHLYQYEVS